MMSPTTHLPTLTIPSTNVPTDPMPTHRQHLPGILGMYACKCASVLQQTQQHVDGLQIRQGTLKDLPKLLPCSACLAGKLNKNRKQPVRNFTDIANLANLYNVPLSRTGATQDHNATPNTAISVDWAGHTKQKVEKGCQQCISPNSRFTYRAGVCLSCRKPRASKRRSSSLHKEIWDSKINNS